MMKQIGIGLLAILVSATQAISLEELFSIPPVIPLSKFNVSTCTANEYPSSQWAVENEFSPDSHIPVLQQLNSTHVDVTVPHTMDPDHYIQHIYITDQNGDLIDHLELGPYDSRAYAVFKFPNTTTHLTPWIQCNSHGRWKGSQSMIAGKDKWEWLLRECKELPQDSIAVGAKINFPTNQDAYKLIVEKSYDKVRIQFIMPTGSFFGFGVSTQMVGADVVVAMPKQDGSSNGVSYDCIDGTIKSKKIGPQNDDTISGCKNNAKLVEEVIADGTIAVTCERPLISSDECDKPILEGVQSFVYAYAEEFGYHKISGRHITEADILSGGSVNENKERNELFVVHGALMSIIWAVLIPIGGAVVRYEKHLLWWLGSHRLIQTIGSIITFPTALLAFRLVDTHFQTAHSIFGVTMTFLGAFQAGIGGIMYQAGKLSKLSLQYMVFNDPYLNDSIKGMLYNDIVVLHQDYFRERQSLFDGCTSEMRTEIIKAEKRFAVTLSCTKKPLWMMLHWKHRIINPIHRVMGRSLIVLGYVQLFLGVYTHAGVDVIGQMLVVWLAMFLIFIVYKEIELQYRLPRGIVAKLKLLLCCCKSKDEKQDQVEKIDDEVDAEYHALRLPTRDTRSFVIGTKSQNSIKKLKSFSDQAKTLQFLKEATDAELDSLQDVIRTLKTKKTTEIVES